jgi:hypothetical protein
MPPVFSFCDHDADRVPAFERWEFILDRILKFGLLGGRLYRGY